MSVRTDSLLYIDNELFSLYYMVIIDATGSLVFQLSIILVFASVLMSPITFAQPVSLRDKIGQMLIVGFEGALIDEQSTIVRDIRENNIGGVILFDYNPKRDDFNKNIRSPRQVRALNARLQAINLAAQKRYHRSHLPLLISVDYEGGDRGTRLTPLHGFPSTLSASSVAQKPLTSAEKIATKMARTLSSNGFNLNFSPVLDVNINKSSPIIGKRSFSSDPDVVVKYAQIFSDVMRANKVQCAYKHFPGHGSATGDSHLGFVDISQTWKSAELIPYQLLLSRSQACGLVMTAHLVNRQLDDTGLPATLSYKMLTTLLRDKLHFKGVIVTDDLQMKAITDRYSLDKAVTLAINAGADMLIFGNQLTDKPQNIKNLINLIEAKVRTGEINEHRIEEAYQRIITLKRTIKSI